MSTTVATRPAPGVAPTSGGVSGLGAFTLRLTRARFSTRQGESLLYGAAILASLVCSLIAFTVAGGTWMFWRRSAHPTGLLAELSGDADFKAILAFYVGLAALACALIVPSLLSLSAAGTQLGARGRERRLAALRLLGLSSGDVTRMALLDALIQTGLGTLIGFLAYLATLPLWQRVSFEAVPIAAGEMLLPWWLMLLVGLALVGLSMLAAAWGLRQVRISPLGVSRRANKPAVRVWRLVTFMLVTGVATVLVPMLRLGRDSAGLLIFAGIIAIIIAGVNLVGPWFLQAGALLTARLPWTAARMASRRIVADPRATWGRVSTLGTLAFIAGFLAVMPFSYGGGPKPSQVEQTFMDLARTDFTNGALITLVCGFALTATSLLITQASATIERAEQTRALHRMGAPDRLALAVMWLETFAPLVLSTVLGGLLGAWFALPLKRLADKGGMETGDGVLPMVGVLLAGLAVAALALLASHPLHRRVLGAQERRND